MATPPPAKVGVLEHPAEQMTSIAGERVAIRGWALAGGAAFEVHARWRGQAAVAIDAGVARADLRSSLDAAADSCGFAGFITTTGLAPGLHTLELTVERAGQTLLSWSRELRLEDADHQYQAWRERVRKAAPAQDGHIPPQVTWYVPSAGRAPARVARTLESAARAGNCVALAWPGGDAGCSTPYFGRLEAGDLLCADSMAALARVLHRRPQIEALYADHDHQAADGRCTDPVFKPGWSPELMHEPLLWQRSWVLRHDLHGASMAALLGDDPQAAWSSILGRPGITVHHLPWPLTSEATPRQVRRVVPPAPAAVQKVAVIVPTRLADPAMLAKCLDSLRAEQGSVELEIVVLLNNLVGADLQSATDFLAPWQVQMVHHEGPFNWSTLCNRGARRTRADWLLFLNDDVEALRPLWLGAMLQVAQRPGVGCVGALLRYADLTIQHAGVWLERRHALAGRHTFRHATGDEARVRRWLAIDREQTAVTGACLLTHRRLFDGAGGFDTTLPVVFNDVDYCIRLRQQGWRSVVAAGAELLHHESVSRVGIPEQNDHQRFHARWSALLPALDPHRHPCLLPESDDWALDLHSMPPDDARP